MKNKILSIFFVLTLFTLVFISNETFAFTFDYNEQTYNIPNFPFDTTEHSQYLFGYVGSNNTFAVGYPEYKAEKFFMDLNGSDSVVRYYKEGTTQQGEFIWFYISSINPTAWSSAQRTNHEFLVFKGGDIIISSLDIYKNATSEEIFFPLTLPEMGLLETTMEMITQEAPEVGTQVVAKMKTILLCGVGCLMLLISLPLLLRVFSRYRH